MKYLSFVGIVSLLLISCSQEGTEQKANASASQTGTIGTITPAEIAQLAKRAGLPGMPKVVFTASLTPAAPVSNGASLFAGATQLWDAGDGQQGAIILSANNQANPLGGAHFGIGFKAQEGITYLTRCRSDSAGGKWHYLYYGGLIKSGTIDPQTQDLITASDPAPADADARYALATEQSGHKIASCDIFGLEVPTASE